MRKSLLTVSTAIILLGLPGVSLADPPSPNPQTATPPTTATPSVAPDGATLAEPAKPALSPADAAVAQQIRAVFETRASEAVPRKQDRAAVEAFYRKRDFAPLWVAASKALPNAGAAAEFLRGVAADGLDPKDYPTPRFADADPARLAAGELALTNSVLAFVRHASTGRVAFSRVSGAVYFDQKIPDIEQTLGQVAASGDVRATLDGFNPQQPQYKALKAELARARTDAKEAKSGRVELILANMERWRWLPRDLAPTYVMVNVPDYTLKVVDRGNAAWSTRIVVGKPGKHSTPLLAETMKYLTVNPTWNVPPSIIRNEYLPALARDPGALSRVGLRVERRGDGSIRIFQPPGERNALGRIRFNFPNRFLVYQHDTPDKHLFDKSARAFSHGCMRVQDPERYAEVLLGLSQPDEGYTIKRIHSLYGSEERTINLKTPIQVYVTYQTAFVDDAGHLQTRADIYGLDKEIANLMTRESDIADVPVARNYNAGNAPVMGSVGSRRNRYAGGYSGERWGWGNDRSGWGWSSGANNGWSNGWSSGGWSGGRNAHRFW